MPIDCKVAEEPSCGREAAEETRIGKRRPVSLCRGQSMEKKRQHRELREFMGDWDAPAPMPARLKPKLAKKRKMAVKLIPADRSTARTSVSKSMN